MKAISYAKLFKILIDRKISKAELRKMCNYSTATATKLNKDEPVSLTTLLDICEKLEVDLCDICESVDL